MFPALLTCTVIMAMCRATVSECARISDSCSSDIVCGCPEGSDNAILNDSNGWYVATCAVSS